MGAAVNGTATRLLLGAIVVTVVALNILLLVLLALGRS
jgi:hypothetical protein